MFKNVAKVTSLIRTLPDGRVTVSWDAPTVHTDGTIVVDTRTAEFDDMAIALAFADNITPSPVAQIIADVKAEGLPVDGARVAGHFEKFVRIPLTLNTCLKVYIDSHRAVEINTTVTGGGIKYREYGSLAEAAIVARKFQ